MFSREFCEIFKNTFSTEHLWETASDGGYMNIMYSFSKFQNFVVELVIRKIIVINNTSKASNVINNTNKASNKEYRHCPGVDNFVFYQSWKL